MVLEFNFGRSNHAVIDRVTQDGKPDLAREPAVMFERAFVRRLACDVACEPNAVGIETRRNSHVRTFSVLQNGNDRDQALDRFPATTVDYPSRAANFLIRVTGDILLEEINQPPVLLQNAKHEQPRRVRLFRRHGLRLCRCFRRHRGGLADYFDKPSSQFRISEQLERQSNPRKKSGIHRVSHIGQRVP